MWGEKAFFEFMLHHACTMFSVIYAYFTNHEDFSVYVMLISNLADMVFNLGRFNRDIALKEWVVNLGYALLIISWFWTRIIVLPYCFTLSSIRLLPYLGYDSPVKLKYQEVWYLFFF